MDTDKNKMNENSASEEIIADIDSDEVPATAIDGEVSQDISDDDISTIGVSKEDVNEALREYGLEPEDDQLKVSIEQVDEQTSEPEKKKFPLQRTVVISAIALLFVAVAVFASIFVYNIFFKPGIDGVWTPTDDSEGSVYFIFDKEGNIEMDGGSIKYYGTYTVDKNDAGNDVIKSEFYAIAIYGGEGEIEYSSDRNTLTLKFESMDLELKKAELPKNEHDPKVITHASADELGITSLNIDKSIVGTWTEETYGTYTFNEDGTGSYCQDYQYIEYYGFGFGTEYKFNYTVSDGNILLSLYYYSGDSEDAMFSYGTDKDNLIIDGIGYSKVN